VPALQFELTVAVPCAGGVTIEQLNGSPLGSDTLGVQEACTAVVALNDTGFAVGGVFPELTVTVTVAGGESACPSFAL
jgi:hypothetical protein